MSHLCAPASQQAKNIRRNVARTSREMILSLYSALVRLLGAVLGFPVQKRHGPTLSSEQQVTKMIKVLENVTYKERLRKLGLFTLGNRFRGILLVVINT